MLESGCPVIRVAIGAAGAAGFVARQPEARR